MIWVRFVRTVANTKMGTIRNLPKGTAHTLRRAGAVEFVDDTQPPAPPMAEPEEAPKKDTSARAIRLWAVENGVDCPPKGRIPAAVRRAYLDS